MSKNLREIDDGIRKWGESNRRAEADKNTGLRFDLGAALRQQEEESKIVEPVILNRAVMAEDVQNMKELAQKRNQEAAAEEIREALGQLIARIQDAEQYGVRTYISVDSDETRIPVKHVIKSRISADL